MPIAEARARKIYRAGWITTAAGTGVAVSAGSVVFFALRSTRDDTVASENLGLVPVAGVAGLGALGTGVGCALVSGGALGTHRALAKQGRWAPLAPGIAALALYPVAAGFFVSAEAAWNPEEGIVGGFAAIGASLALSAMQMDYNNHAARTTALVVSPTLNPGAPGIAVGGSF